MRRSFVHLFLALITAIPFFGCSGSSNAELQKARAEANEARAEAARLKAELDKVKVESGQQSSSQPESPKNEQQGTTSATTLPWAEVSKAKLTVTATKPNRIEALPKTFSKEEWDLQKKKQDELILAAVQGKPGITDFLEKSQLTITGRQEGTDQFDTIAFNIVLLRDFVDFWFDENPLKEKHITGLTLPNKYAYFVYDFVLTGAHTKDGRIEGTLKGTFCQLPDGPGDVLPNFVFSNLSFKDATFTLTKD